jgi:hypothetical protein
VTSIAELATISSHLNRVQPTEIRVAGSWTGCILKGEKSSKLSVFCGVLVHCLTSEEGNIKTSAMSMDMPCTSINRLELFFADGSTGSSLVVGMSDLTNGSGTNNGYLTLNFNEGSVFFMKYSGTNKVESSKAPRGGPFTVIGGKGRYEGAKGDGTWAGDGTRSGPAAIVYIDGVVNITK